ncbi:MAG: hypothetical protein ACFCVH_23015 [Alphaproteobacteria bacterium]
MTDAPGRGRDIWRSLMLALGLWALLALAMFAVSAAFPAGEERLDWPLFATGLVAAFYIAAAWQFIPSLGWFIAGLALWSVVAFALLAVVPIAWLEPIFGPAAPAPVDVVPPPGEAQPGPV